MSGAVVYPRPYGAAGRAAAQAVETLALTLWAEAGERPVRAIEALATLVVNRARLAATRGEAARLRFAPDAAPTGATATPWPLLLGRVCQAPFLFACWNPRHPRHAAGGQPAAPSKQKRGPVVVTHRPQGANPMPIPRMRHGVVGRRRPRHRLNTYNVSRSRLREK